ncbi:MAG: glycosyltransferase, partial [Terracidiphilus sp.]
MRIVTVLTSLGMGGAEKQARAVAERMAKRGHEVAVLVLKSQVPEEWPTTTFTVHLNMRKSPSSFVVGIGRASSFLRDFKPDLVHSHSFHANIFARMLKIGVPSIPVVSTVHNVYEGGRLRMAAYRLTDGLSRRTIAVSRTVADRFVSIRAIPERKSLVIRNGIDTSEFAPGAERRVSTRAAMDADSRFIWLAAGRIVAAKDFPNLLRAFRQARSEFPHSELWIAGAPEDASRTTDGFSGYLSLMAVERGCEEQVRWLGLRRDVPALLDAADGFVLGSAWEGMPLAVGEAMAMEKPVVVTDTGGVRELVGDTGVVVPTRNHEALAQGMIETMRQSGAQRAEWGRAARERIIEHFSIEAVSDAWE